MPILLGAFRWQIRDNESMDKNETAVPSPPALAPEDFYLEGPYLIFTAAYHLKRGSCCGSGCRHCPYRENETPDGEENELH
ncbi:MAG: DUF5522 domain-containing protein [Terracidiphilus sp.]